MGSKSSALAVRVALSGPAITDRYSLGDVARILCAIDYLYRSAYESLAGVDVEDYQLQVSAAFPESGSYIVELLLSFQNVAALTAPLLPMLSAISPKDVFENAKSAIELWTSLFKKPEQKEPEPTLNIAKNEGIVIVNTGSGPLKFDRAALLTAAKSQDELKHLAYSPLGGEITSIEMSSEEGSVKWNEQAGSALVDRPRLDLRGEVSRMDQGPSRAQQFHLRGNIVRLDKSQRCGVVRVENDKTLPPGDYPFSIVGDQLLRPYIQAMAFDEVELEYRPVLGPRKKIAALNVLGVSSGRTGDAAA